jgi:hypothetical protein
MQYSIRSHADVPDPATFEQLLHRLDAAALVDRDPLTGEVRVSSIVGADELVDLLRTAGFKVKGTELARLPSECCGGCGG